MTTSCFTAQTRYDWLRVPVLVVGAVGATVVVERLWFAAFSRTAQLTKGYRWWIVLLLILFALAMIVVYLAMFLVAWLVGQVGGTVAAVLLGIVGFVGMVIILGTGIALVALLYARLREIKEGTTLESLADVFE